MDAVIILLIVIILTLLFKRSWSSIIYAIVIVDIFLRLVTFVKVTVCTGELLTFLDKNIPESIPMLIQKYASGVFETILLWVLFAVYVLFEFYIIRTFWKKR